MRKLTKALMDATPTLYQYSPCGLDTNGTLLQAVNGTSFVGCFLGVEWTDLATGRPMISNNWQNGVLVKNLGVDSARIYFYEDPLIVYQIQMDAATTLASAGDQINFDANIAAGNTITGLSTAKASTLVGAGAQGMLRILNESFGIDNDWTDAFPDLLVQIARHQYVADRVAV